MHYILCIEEGYQDKKKLYLFTTKEKAEEWVYNAYFRIIVPYYFIIKIENIDDVNKIDEPLIIF